MFTECFPFPFPEKPPGFSHLCLGWAVCSDSFFYHQQPREEMATLKVRLSVLIAAKGVPRFAFMQSGDVGTG